MFWCMTTVSGGTDRTAIGFASRRHLSNIFSKILEAEIDTDDLGSNGHVWVRPGLAGSRLRPGLAARAGGITAGGITAGGRYGSGITARGQGWRDHGWLRSPAPSDHGGRGTQHAGGVADGSALRRAITVSAAADAS